MYSYENPTLVIPNELVLDTSFVVDALITTEPRHAAARQFMLRLVTEQTTVFYNRLLELEFAEVAFKIACIESPMPGSWKAKRNDGRVRRRAGRLTDALMREWNDLLTTVPHLLIELHEVAADVPRFMTQYGLASYDAAHAATATYVGAGGIVTNDRGFGHVAETALTIFTEATGVRTCRQHRGGR